MANKNPIELPKDSKELVKGYADLSENIKNKQIKIINTPDFLALAKSRRSIRGFKNQDVSKEQLMKLIEAAQSAPSGGNCQPWHFYVIKDKKLQADIKEKACGQGWILTASAFIVVCAEGSRSASSYGERGRDLYSIQDTAAAVQNILLCAKDMGLGTCWCGAFDESKLSEILNLPEKFRPIAIVPIGYPENDSYPPQNRRPIDEIVTFID